MNKPEGMPLRGNDVLPGAGRVAVLIPCFNEAAAVANQHGCQTGEPVFHDTACKGMGMARANPAR
jgi:hypothetical protein